MSTFTLKMIALLLMLVDHVGEFFPHLPVVLRWLGRLSGPLFIFCVVQGVWHTSNQKRYLLRLYVGSAIMGIGNAILTWIFPHSPVLVFNNIFPTMFFIAIVCFLHMLFQKDPGKAKKYLLLLVGSQVIAVFLSFLAGTTGSYAFAFLVNGVIPNVVTCEGSLPLILLGYLLYRYGNSPKSLSQTYLIFCAIMLLISISSAQGPLLQYLFLYDYQWMMVASLPLMLAYNGQKGRSMKYLFYLFYPLHIWFLFTLSNLLIKLH